MRCGFLPKTIPAMRNSTIDFLIRLRLGKYLVNTREGLGIESIISEIG
jgi:hypothetical protein